jgi:anthranilate phosphoribosyltransferase
MAEALSLLGSQRAAVVCGEDGLDEVTLAGSTHVALAEGGKVLQLEWTPGDFGLEPSGREELLVDGPAQSAAVIQGILAGKQGPARDIVVANSAAALWTARKSEDLRRCAELVSTAIDTGAAANLLDRLKEQTQSRS